MPRIWVDSIIDVDVATGTQAVDVLTSEFGTTDLRVQQMTLLRTIIGLDFARTVHDSGEGSEKLALGIGIFSQEANIASVFPEPGVAGDHPTRGWIWRGHYRVFGFAADQPAVSVRRIDLDLRGMRKLENGVCALVMDLSAMEGANSTTTVLGIIRQLWLTG